MEWDTERVLELNAGTFIILGSILGVKSGRFWFLLTGLVGLFMTQHSLQGWCPPVPVVRKWGVRTADEINAEKTVLKMMRGDFKKESSDVVELLNIADKQ